MKKLIIIGASGHGKVVADIAKKNEYTDISFLDDNTELSECAGYPVIGTCSDLDKIECDFVVAIGDAHIRKQLQERISSAGKCAVTLIHPDAVIGENVVVGEGTVIMAGAVVNPYATIGKGCIINTCASVDHDSTVGDYVHISVGAHLSGIVEVGKNTWIGVGAVVNNCITICENCTVGAGSVVIKDIEESGTYVGVPAKKVK